MHIIAKNKINCDLSNEDELSPPKLFNVLSNNIHFVILMDKFELLA